MPLPCVTTAFLTASSVLGSFRAFASESDDLTLAGSVSEKIRLADSSAELIAGPATGIKLATSLNMLNMVLKGDWGGFHFAATQVEAGLN